MSAEILNEVSALLGFGSDTHTTSEYETFDI